MYLSTLIALWVPKLDLAITIFNMQTRDIGQR